MQKRRNGVKQKRKNVLMQKQKQKQMHYDDHDDDEMQRQQLRNQQFVVQKPKNTKKTKKFCKKFGIIMQQIICKKTIFLIFDGNV